jgi:uncharacterized membrane protein
MKTFHVYALVSMFFAGLTSVLAKSGLKNVEAIQAFRSELP